MLQLLTQISASLKELQYTKDKNYNTNVLRSEDKSVPVTTAWRALRFLMEELPPVWRVAGNILNKQSRTADKVWSFSVEGWARC
jgi:SLT domain-containing protein